MELCKTCDNENTCLTCLDGSFREGEDCHCIDGYYDDGTFICK